MKSDNISYSSRDLNKLQKEFKNNLINSLCGYKSTNLIGTINSKKKTNLAIYNTVIHLGSNPPLMGMVVRTPVRPRHTLSNIIETNVYTVNHVTHKFYHRAHQTAARYKNEDKSEFDIVGLTPYYSGALEAPYVEESPVKIGLKFKEEVEIKSNGSILVIGEVVELIVPKNAVHSDGLVDLGVTNTITSSGLDTYYWTTKLARLSFANPGEELNIIG